MRSLSDDERIARARAADIADIALRVGARLKRVTATEWAGPCPACGGADRFSINTKRRVFNCRGFGGGDVLDLVQHALGLDFAAALEFVTGEAHQVVRPEPSPATAAAKPANLDDEKRRIESARGLWRRRRPIVEATPPWVYLRDVRGYLGPIPATLGYLPARGDFPPAMIAAYGLATEPEPGVLAIADASVRAVHLTRLAQDGSGKAGGKDSKITIGSPLGSPIVLAPPNDGLGLASTEGIEDGLSIHAATGLGVWAAGCAPYMPALADVVPAWMDCVTVVGDRDEAGVRYASEFVSRLKARGFDTRLTFLEAGAAS